MTQCAFRRYGSRARTSPPIRRQWMTAIMSMPASSMRPGNMSPSFKTVLMPLALALLLASGVAAAQSQNNAGQSPPRDADKSQTAEADKADADKAAQPPAKPKPDSRKPKRDKSSDDKDSGRELEEEEDI
jgi:predicted component of type VI protein secretion system